MYLLNRSLYADKYYGAVVVGSKIYGVFTVAICYLCLKDFVWDSN